MNALLTTPQVYNLHFKYDDKNTDYLDWDLGLDMPLDHKSTSSSKSTTKPTSTSKTTTHTDSTTSSSWDAATKGTTTSSSSSTEKKTTSAVDDGMPEFFFEKEHPYFSYYDDIYGDYFFADPFEQDVDCVLKDDGTPKLDGRRMVVLDKHVLLSVVCVAYNCCIQFLHGFLCTTHRCARM